MLVLGAAFVPATVHAETKLTPEGYVEGYIAWNANRPSNGVTNERGFDDRHATFTLSNAVFGGTGEIGPVSARVLFQIGATPTSYYSAEPRRSGGTASGASDGNVWKYLQTAYITWKPTSAFRLEGGLFVSPIGVESMPVKDNFNYSRSNLFFGLPFYHTGIRGVYAISDSVELGLAAYNGWNSVVDNNEEKSVAPTLVWKTASSQVQLLYFGGVERNSGGPEGAYWRHTFDVSASYDATSWLSLQAEGNVGLEPNRIGVSSWAAFALGARYKLLPWLMAAGRVDRFGETMGKSAASSATASPIFWSGAPWVSSQTLTLDVRPVSNLSIRLELRHDQAGSNLYYRGEVEGTGEPERPFVPNARSQNTALLGFTAWL